MEPAIESILAKHPHPSAPPRHRHKKKKPEPKRFAGIDIVKITALFFVTAVHFFLHTGFYTTPITAEFGRGAIYFRWIAFCCVPLFMITTGYLMKNKTLSVKYYCGILRVLIIYVCISLICMAFNYFYLHTPTTFWGILRGLLMYNGAQYGWYVEYYFTLYALIPFLNAGYHALQTRSAKRALLVTVILLTVVSPSFYLGTDYATQIRVLPGYFNRCYPIAYYLIGVYIRDYPPQHNPILKLFYTVIGTAALIWVSATTYHQSLNNTGNGSIWRSWHYDDYGAWPVAVMSTVLFLLLFDIRCKNRTAAKILQRLSNATFAAYLISYVFDMLAYQRLNGNVPEVPARFAFAPKAVLFVFVCSIVSGLLIQGCYDLTAKKIQTFAAYHRNRNARRGTPYEQ